METEKTTNTKTNSEEQDSGADTFNTAETAEPEILAHDRKKSGEADNLESFIAKIPMPDADKADLQKDYSTIQYINIYQGNHVENSGTVYGDISQSHGKSAAPGASMASAQTIQDFFRPGVHPNALGALLTLAVLESVHESSFFEVSSSLAVHLRQVTGSGEDEQSSVLAYLQTADELLSPFSLQRNDLPFTYGSAVLSFSGLSFCDEQLPGKVRSLAWRMYPQLRPVLVDWLLDFQTRVVTAVDRAMCYAAIRGLARCAALDVEYACRVVIPRLVEQCTRQADVKYLTAFFMEFMQVESCRAAADEVLRRWCGKNSRFLWQVPYQLYSDTGQWSFCEYVPLALRKRIECDFAGLGSSEEEQNQQNRGYFLYPAHSNSAAAALLTKEISKIFSERKPYLARCEAALYFLLLFHWDYLTDFSSTPRLCFLYGFHNKDTRTSLLPILGFILGNFTLRNIMRQVLEKHFAELAAYDAPVSYLERPIEFLAFTKRPIDYQNTIRLLKECSKNEKARPVAEHLICHLTGIIRQRQQDQINRKGLMVHGRNI